MIKLIAIGAATAISIGAASSIGSGSSGNGAAETKPPHTAVFHQPRVNGANLDTKFMEHMQPSARQVAARFCLDRGYSSVSNYLLRPSAVTMTITDGVRHEYRGETRQAFSMIECATPA